MKTRILVLGFLLTGFAICSAQESIATPQMTITSSVESSEHVPDAAIDGVIPATSSDYRIPRFTFEPEQGSLEWIQIDFDGTQEIRNIGVYWFDEAQAGPVTLPKSWKLHYLKNGKWKTAVVENSYGVERDQFNIAWLTKTLKAEKIKLEIQLCDELSAGILELQLNMTDDCTKERTFTDPDKELQRIRKKAETILEKDVDEFNGYSHLNGNRPEFDGWLTKENNHDFLKKNIPKFLCSDEDFTEVYNYRWWMITKHLKHWAEDGETYYVFTEFPGFPGWAANSGAIPAPAGHQFYDLRWMRDSKYLQSYISYWLAGPPSVDMQKQNNTWLATLPRPQSHHYTSWMVSGAEALLKIHPDAKWRDALLPAMERHQKIWDLIFQVKVPGSLTDGLYKCLDMYDANEFTISTTLGLVAAQGAFKEYNASINADEPYKGQEKWRRYFTDGKGWQAAYKEGQHNYPNIYPQEWELNLEEYPVKAQAFGGNHLERSYPNCFTVRPSLNCYMYGNYHSLATLYDLSAAEKKDEELQKKGEYYAQVSSELRDKFIQSLWYTPSGNEDYSFYTQRGAINDPFFYSRLAGDNLHTGGVVDQLSIIRESVGYTPWYFNMLPKENAEFDIAWKQFGDTLGFMQPFGMSTAEYRHDYFNEMSYGWNGRGWPFQNSVVYKAYANYLKNYKAGRSGISHDDRQLLFDHMKQYVELHGRRRTIGEWYLPRDGGYRMPGGGPVVQSKPGQGKGFGDVQDYFHSTFPDMLIEDLLGFSGSHEKEFSIEPLLPEEEWDFFYLGDLRYHGHDIDIMWKSDWDENHVGKQSMLYVWVDGSLYAKSGTLNTKLKVELP